MSYFMGLQVISQIKSFLTNNTFVSFGTYRLIYSWLWLFKWLSNIFKIFLLYSPDPKDSKKVSYVVF